MKKPRLIMFAAVVLVLAAGLVAFRPFGGDADDDGVPDQTEALAEVLGIDVETLQTAMTNAQEKALEQAIADGVITQEQADQMQSGERVKGVKPFRLGGSDRESYLADELGISVEALQTAQREAADLMLDQALEDGKITQEEYDKFQTRSIMRPYFEEAYSSAFQSAIDAALADGTITEAQAEQLQSSGPAFGGRNFGMGKMPGGMHPHFHGPESEGE